MHPLLNMPRNKYAVGGEVEEIEAPHEEPMADAVQAAQELISAIQSGSAEEVAEAFKAMFEICDAQPHVEGEHI